MREESQSWIPWFIVTVMGMIAGIAATFLLFAASGKAFFVPLLVIPLTVAWYVAHCPEDAH